jgi:hypothetical protein
MADITELSMLRQGSTLAPGAAAEVYSSVSSRVLIPTMCAGVPSSRDDNAQRIAQLEAGGRALPCTRQIFEEVGWLVGYATYWQKVERRFADL